MVTLRVEAQNLALDSDDREGHSGNLILETPIIKENVVRSYKALLNHE